MNPYFNEVAKHLSMLPEDESMSIIQFYSEYYDEEGKTERDLYDELGTPKKFAKVLIGNYLSENDNPVIFKEKPIKSIRWLLVGILASPILLPFAIALVAILFAMIVVVISLIFAFVAVILSLFAAGIAMIVSGFFVIGSSFFTSLFFIGAGFVGVGVSLLFLPLAIRFSKWSISMIQRCLQSIIKKISSKRKVGATYEN